MTLSPCVMIDNNSAEYRAAPMQSLFNHGRLAGTGYLSILPVDQGVEHSAAASLPLTRSILIRKNIVELAIEAGCNCVALYLRCTGFCCPPLCNTASRSLSKINHNETLSLPAQYDQTPYASVEQAFEMGAVAVGATIYFLAHRNPAVR